MRDADLLYFDPDTSWDAEDAVIGATQRCSATCRCRRRYGTRRGYTSGTATASARRRRRSGTVPAPSTPLRPCCSHGVTVDADLRPRVCTPYGYDDLFGLVVRPNRCTPASRHVYEAKAARWTTVWPELTVLPWEDGDQSW